jgi:hypothetical protein
MAANGPPTKKHIQYHKDGSIRAKGQTVAGEVYKVTRIKTKTLGRT